MAKFRIPKGATLVTVELVRPGGSVITRRIPVTPTSSLNDISTMAFRACGRARVSVESVLRITHGDRVLFAREAA